MKREHALETTTILDLLGTHERAVAAALLQRDPTTSAVFGLYSWWADDEARGEIGTALDVEVQPLIYIGQSGGGTSTRSLWSRISGNHLSGTIRTSTLRFALSAILVRDRGPLRALREADIPREAAVSAWMREHLSVVVVAVPDRDTVLALEARALARYDPPLNLQGMSSSPARNELRALRAALGRRRVARVD